MKKILHLIGFLCFGLGVSFAQVDWASLEKNIEAKPGEVKVPFSFEFTINKGTVELEQPVSTCGCTVPTLEKKSFTAGEAGKIEGFFSVGNRRGTSLVQISIKGRILDGKTETPFMQVLKLRVYIPEILSITSGVNLWRKGAQPEVKTIKLEVKQANPMKLTLSKFDSNIFAVNLKEVFPNRSYELEVVPISTEVVAQERLEIEGLNSDGQKAHFYVNFLVR